MKFLSILPVAMAVNETFDASCDGQGVLTFNYTHDRLSHFHSFDAASKGCNVTQVVNRTSAIENITITVPEACLDTERKANVQMYFTAIKGMDVLVDSKSLIANCPALDDNYKVSYDFNLIDIPVEEKKLTSELPAVEFSIERTLADFTTKEPSSQINIGDKAFFRIWPSNNKFNFEVGSCSVGSTITPNAFTFLDLYDPKVCAIEALEVKAVKVPSPDANTPIEWHVEYNAFRFDNKLTAHQDYKLECEIFACRKTSKSTDLCTNGSKAIEDTCFNGTRSLWPNQKPEAPTPAPEQLSQKVLDAVRKFREEILKLQNNDARMSLVLTNDQLTEFLKFSAVTNKFILNQPIVGVDDVISAPVQDVLDAIKQMNVNEFRLTPGELKAFDRMVVDNLRIFGVIVENIE